MNTKQFLHLLGFPLAVLPFAANGATVTWVGPADGNINDAANWSNNAPPSAGNDYSATGGSIRAFFAGSFAGDSLTVTNGAFRLNNNGVMASQTRNVSNLTLDNSNLDIWTSNTSLSIALTGGITFSGSNTVTYTGGAFSNIISLADTVSGSGSVSIIGSAAANHARYFNLTSAADASGYTGNWALTGTNANNTTIFTVSTTTGWGSGDVTMNGFSTLALSIGTTALDASESSVSMTATDKFSIGSGETTVKILSFGGTGADAGTYTAADLNTLFSTSAFSGAGSIIIIPEPSTAALLGGVGMLSLLRRRK